MVQHPQAQRQAFRLFAEHIEKESTLFAALFALPTTAEAQQHTVRVLAKALQACMGTIATPPPGIRPDALSEPFAAAYLLILQLRASGAQDLSVDDVMAHFAALMPPRLTDPSAAEPGASTQP